MATSYALLIFLGNRSRGSFTQRDGIRITQLSARYSAKNWLSNAHVPTQRIDVLISNDKFLRYVNRSLSIERLDNYDTASIIIFYLFYRLVGSLSSIIHTI